MTQHIEMRALKNSPDVNSVKAQPGSCLNMVPGRVAFEVATRTAALAGSCDVVLYSKFVSATALVACQMHPHHQAVAAALGVLRPSRVDMDYAVQSLFQHL